MTGRHRSAGFTLIEVAIAMAIVGIGVVTAIELFSAALKTEQSAGVRARAVVRARGLMDQTMTIPELQPGQDVGQWEDGYHWERQVREAPEFLDEEDRDGDAAGEVTMLEIRVSVLWPQTVDREGVYTLQTLRLVPRAAR